MSEGSGIPVGTGLGTVAVILPVYNGEAFIRRALDSVLRRTHRAAEIVVVDDGSRDRTREIVAEEYGGAVRLLTQQNGGPAEARNAGQRMVTAEFVAFLDADDWWEPEKLEKQVAALERNADAVANYTGVHSVDAESGRCENLAPSPLEWLGQRMRWCSPLMTPSCLMARRDAVEKAGGFREEQVGGEDWGLWMELVARGRFCVCPEPLTYYQVSSAGLSGNATLMFDEVMKMLEDVLLRDLSGVRRAVWRRRIVSYQAYKGVLTARASGDAVVEREFVKRSLLAWPSPMWAPERFKAFAVTLLRRGQRAAAVTKSAGPAAGGTDTP